jgi:hypothetical protein
MIQQKTDVALQTKPIGKAICYAITALLSFSATNAAEEKPIPREPQDTTDLFRLDLASDPIKVGGMQQIPFDKQKWQSDAGSRMHMMGDVIKTKAFIGWPKSQMDQDFGDKAITKNEGYTTYDIARVARFACGYGLEVVYTNDVVESYRLVRFAPHSGAVADASEWSRGAAPTAPATRLAL